MDVPSLMGFEVQEVIPSASVNGCPPSQAGVLPDSRASEGASPSLRPSIGALTLDHHQKGDLLKF